MRAPSGVTAGGSECPELGTEQREPTRSEQSWAEPWAQPLQGCAAPRERNGRVVPMGRGHVGWGGGGHAGHKQQSTAQGLQTRHYPDSTSKSIIDKSQLAYSGGAALREAQGLVFHLKGKEGKRSVSESTAGGTAALGKALDLLTTQCCKQSPKGPRPQPRCCVSGLDDAAGPTRLLLSSQGLRLHSREGRREEKQK